MSAIVAVAAAEAEAVRLQGRLEVLGGSMQLQQEHGEQALAAAQERSQVGGAFALCRGSALWGVGCLRNTALAAASCPWLCPLAHLNDNISR